MGRSVVDIGLEILRAEGALIEPIVDTPDQPVEPALPTELDVMQQLTAQLQQMADRLSLADQVRALGAQMVTLTALVEQLTTLVTQPRVKVPIRDEAGRIIEVREVTDPTGSHGY